MKSKQAKKPHKPLFIQVWIDELENGSMQHIKPTDFQTLIALSRYSDSSGVAFPSLYGLAKILGISHSTASRRIKSLKQARIEGEPLIQVTQSKNKKGSGFIWGTNIYQITPTARKLVSIFDKSDMKKRTTEQKPHNIGQNTIPAASSSEDVDVSNKEQPVNKNNIKEHLEENNKLLMMANKARVDTAYYVSKRNDFTEWMNRAGKGDLAKPEAFDRICFKYGFDAVQEATKKHGRDESNSGPVSNFWNHLKERCACYKK